jgi:cytochrome c-type biogenesis protein CcmH/NrfG
MRAFNEHYRAAMLLTMTKHPDLGQVESLLAHSAQLDPTAYPTWISLGNVRAKRGARDEAIRAFAEARKWVDPGDPLRGEIETHIARLRTSPPQKVAALTNPWAE